MDEEENNCTADEIASFVVVTLLACGAGCAAHRSGAALRVHAGQPDSRNEFPFLVRFERRFDPIVRTCSGSLIAPNWVLSAAHCLGSPRFLIVRYGDFTLPRNETKSYSNVIKVFHHSSSKIIENLKKGKFNFRDDIGLALVEKILNKPTARLLAADYKTLFGLPVKYAGFGITVKAKFGIKFTELLKLASDLKFAPRVGEGIIGPCTGLDKQGPVICVSAKCANRKEAPRDADSGGPLIYDGRIIGVVKSGNYFTSDYTPVSIYLEWIQAVMRSNR